MGRPLVFNNFKEIFDKYYDKVDNGHRGDHVKRVLKNAQRIAKTIKDCDHDVVLVNCLFHDICRATEIDDHAVEGAVLARELLKDHHILTPDQIDNICDSIETHRFSRGKVARTIEGKILQDADRLDSIGPIGIVRTLQYSIKKGKPIYDQNIPPAEVYNKNTPRTTAINHIIEKQMSIRIDTFNFPKSQIMAKEHISLTKKFVELYVDAMNV